MSKFHIVVLMCRRNNKIPFHSYTTFVLMLCRSEVKVRFVVFQCSFHHVISEATYYTLQLLFHTLFQLLFACHTNQISREIREIPAIYSLVLPNFSVQFCVSTYELSHNKDVDLIQEHTHICLFCHIGAESVLKNYQFFSFK